MNAPTVVVLLTLLLGLQPVTTDLYLPLLPTLARELNATPGSAKMTLSALIIAFGIGQLFCGPWSDRFGRRPVLVAGLSIYVLASVASMAAPSVEWLIAWRALQGLGMAAAITCGRAIVRDLYAPHEGARMLSRSLTGLGILATASPFIGSLAGQWMSWPGTFAAMGAFAAVALGAVLWRLQETNPRPDPEATRWRPLLHSATVVLRHPGFRAWVLLLMSTYGGLFLMLAASSFVYIEVLGLTPLAYSLWLSTNSLAYITGTVLCRRLLARRGLAGAVAIGGGFSVVGGGSMAALAAFDVLSPWAIAGPHVLYAIGHGIHQPCGQAGAVGPFPERAGTASALSGFLMMATAFSVGLWIGTTSGTGVHALAGGMAFFGVLCALIAWTLVRRHGELAAAVPKGAGLTPKASGG